MRARQIMTQPVVTITADAPIAVAANLMLDRHISGLPVINAAGQLVGMVSQGDFIRRAEIGTQRRRGRWLKFLVGPSRAAADFVREQGRKVGEIMTSEPCTVTEEATLEDIVELMERHNIKRVPVVRGEQLVGIVTRSNLLQAVAGLARDVPDPTADDDHIRSDIINSITQTDWAPFGLSVIVLNGIVHLNGVITNEQSREAAIVASENVAGVKTIHDHLCWVEPMSGIYLNSQEDENLLKAK